MNMNKSPDEPVDSQEQRLFRRLSQGDLTPEEFQELEQRLLVSPELQQRYLEFVHLEATLEEVLAEVPANLLPVHNSTATSPRRVTSRNRYIVLGAIAILLLIAGTTQQFLTRSQPGRLPAEIAEHSNPPELRSPIPDDDTITANPAEREPTPSKSLTAAGMTRILERLPDAAVVTSLDEEAARSCEPPLQVGKRLKPGLFKLTSGELRLDFLSGAMVTLQGPAEFLLISSDEATLFAGHATANVPEAARGFILNGPRSAVYDLGTEFTLSVIDEENSEVRVLDGEVEVSLLGDDGNTFQSQRVQGSQMVRLGETITPLDPPALDPTETIDSKPNAATPLNVPAEYTQAVLDDGATIYWRFEDDNQETVRNAAGEEGTGRLVPDSHPDSGIWQAQGQLNFATSKKPRFLELDTVLEQFNDDSFSIEMWVNPSQFHHGSILSVVEKDDPLALRHLIVLELAHRTSVVHRPGAFRFLYRHPPNVQGGLNLFSQQSCIPGQWHYLVATKSPEQMRFYLNGELVRELAIEPDSDDRPYRLFLGSLRNSNSERQFRGSIDEVAIYKEVLTPDQVATHFRLMNPE